MRKTVVILLVMLILISSIEAQCAMCRAVLESEEGQNTAKGINNGIIYLMMIPYLLIGGIGFYLYRRYKDKS